jgi:hypothetical protein
MTCWYVVAGIIAIPILYHLLRCHHDRQVLISKGEVVASDQMATSFWIEPAEVWKCSKCGKNITWTERGIGERIESYYDTNHKLKLRTVRVTEWNYDY